MYVNALKKSLFLCSTALLLVSLQRATQVHAEEDANRGTETGPEITIFYDETFETGSTESSAAHEQTKTKDTEEVQDTKEISELSLNAVALGNALTKEQRKETLSALKQGQEVPIYDTTGEDLMLYIPQGNFTKDWAVYSSVYVSTQEEGTGVQVEIATPDNITSITPAQYRNAAQTAGLTDVKLTIASVVPIDGSGALAGVYKVVKEAGGKVDTTRTEVAQTEMQTLNEIANSNKDVEGFTDTALNEAQEQVKGYLANQVKSGEKITDKDISNAVSSALEAQGLQLSDVEQQKLADVLGQMQDANIFDKLNKEMDTEKFEELKAQSKGFISKAGAFFKSVWDSFINMFSSKDIAPGKTDESVSNT